MNSAQEILAEDFTLGSVQQITADLEYLLKPSTPKGLDDRVDAILEAQYLTDSQKMFLIYSASEYLSSVLLQDRLSNYGWRGHIFYEVVDRFIQVSQQDANSSTTEDLRAFVKNLAERVKS